VHASADLLDLLGWTNVTFVYAYLLGIGLAVGMFGWESFVSHPSQIRVDRTIRNIRK